MASAKVAKVKKQTNSTGKKDYDAIDESERKLSDYEILSTIGKSMVFDFFNFTFMNLKRK